MKHKGEQMKELVTKLTHGTRDEVRYLRHIGAEAGSKLPRSQLLANYIAAALLRTKWGNLDKETLLAELRESAQVGELAHHPGLRRASHRRGRGFLPAVHT